MRFLRKIILIFALCGCMQAQAQRATVSTDALGWLMGSPNFGLSAIVAPQYTLDMQISYNPFSQVYPSIGFNHASISLQSTYWLKRPYYAHGIGLYAAGTIYDVQFFNNYFKGIAGSVGVAYQYGFILSKRWSVMPTVAIGVALVADSDTRNYSIKPMLNKFGVSFTYILD